MIELMEAGNAVVCHIIRYGIGVVYCNIVKWWNVGDMW